MEMYRLECGALPRAWLRGPGCLGGNKGTDSSSRRLIEAFNFLTASAHVLQNFLKNNLIWGSKQDNNTSSQFRFEKSLSNFWSGFDPGSIRFSSGFRIQTGSSRTGLRTVRPRRST